MTTLVVQRTTEQSVAVRSPAVTLLQIFAFSLLVFPSDTVFKAVGGGGYVGALVAYLLFACYLAVLLFGLHNPFDYRSPIRVGLASLWIVALISYSLMNRTLLSSAQQSSATRWLIQLVAMSGVILVTSEFLRSVNDLHKVLRWLTYGGAIAGMSAALQYWLDVDITTYFRRIPGFSLNQAAGTIAIGSRSGLNRVAGTATDPIEMGVVAGMLLPLAIYLAMNDTERSALKRWIPVACIAVAIPITISRAGILSAVIAMPVLIIALPPARRLATLAAIPVGLGVVFLSAHRLLGTLLQYFTLGSSDGSISHRVNNLPYALNLVAQAPWFGHGGGTYIAGNVINLGEGHILDDQYLDTAIELGVIGLCVLFFFLLWPAVTAIVASVKATDRRLRELSAAVAGSALAGVACSATFDALSFPMFVMMESLVIGLAGAAWLIASRDASEVAGKAGRFDIFSEGV
jgi:O-antigen ligase